MLAGHLLCDWIELDSLIAPSRGSEDEGAR
jgi:hypothetical protein